MKLKLLLARDTRLEYDSRDAPDTAKVLMKDVNCMSTFESFKRIDPPIEDAARPEKSDDTILLRTALFRPPKRDMPAPATEDASQNLEAAIVNADPWEASKYITPPSPSDKESETKILGDVAQSLKIIALIHRKQILPSKKLP